MHVDVIWMGLLVILGAGLLRARVRGLSSYHTWSLFFWVGLGVLVVRWCFWEPFKTEGVSMAPTIPPHSLVVVNKTAYSTKFPFVLWRGPLVYPRIRDVVAFEHGEDVYVKRVQGKSGDWLMFDVQHGWYINGRFIAPPQTKDLSWLYHVGFPDGKHYNLNALSRQVTQQWQQRRRWQVQIPAGYIFVVGDNRSQSIDSRFFGFVPVSSLVGEVKKVSDLPLVGQHGLGSSLAFSQKEQP